MRATRDREASRETILAAATAEFAEFGLRGARSDKIAQRAGCDKKLIYHYFGTKRELYELIVRQDFDRLAQVVEGLDTTDPEDALRQFVRRYVAFLAENPAHARLAVQEEIGGESIGRPLGLAARRRVFGTLGGIIREGQAAGTFRRDLDPESTAMSVVAACMHPFTLRQTLAELSAKPTTDESLATYAAHVESFVSAALSAKGNGARRAGAKPQLRIDAPRTKARTSPEETRLLVDQSRADAGDRI